MTLETVKQPLVPQLKDLVATVENLRRMLGAARHAFNRHSLAKLEEMAQLRDDIILDLDPWFEQVDAELKKAPAASRDNLLKIKEILTGLEVMADAIARLADPIRRKSNHGAIFGDKEFFQINDLFAQFAGLLRALVDLFLYQDASLKVYVHQECQKMKSLCFAEENDHATQMMDSPGQHGAWSIHLDMLDRFREAMKNLVMIVDLL